MGASLQPPFPLLCPYTPPQIMEVASPTAGSVLVELAQLQLLQACRAVAVRTMSPHGESADSLPAPVPPALQLQWHLTPTLTPHGLTSFLELTTIQNGLTSLFFL